MISPLSFYIGRVLYSIPLLSRNKKKSKLFTMHHTLLTISLII